MPRTVDRLNALALFISIVEKRGLAAAGREHGLSPASVSERLNQLESAYGARLLNRTTRSISLTDAGEQLLDGARHLVAEAENLESMIRDGVHRLSGLIRIGAPIDLGRTCLAPILDRFMAEHPAVRIDLQLSDGYVDLIDQRLDVAVRRGRLEDSSLIVRTLASNRRVVCASPSYARQHPLPENPLELDQHNCLIMRFGAEQDNVWPFRIANRTEHITVRGNRIANDGQQVRNWCLAGHGLAYKSEWDIRHHLDAGELFTCLADFEIEPSAVQVVYPSSTGLPTRVRALVDYFIQAFAREGRADVHKPV